MKKLLLALLIVGLLGCEKDENEQTSQTVGKITHIDVSGAKALYTTVSETSSVKTKSVETAPAPSSSLFKIFADGTSSEITVQDENGKEINFTDSKVFPANDNLIAFNFNTPQGHYEYYIRKNDGAVFEIPQSLWGHYDHEYYIPPYDKYQNIYITSHESNNIAPIYKIPNTFSGEILANKISDNYIVNRYFADFNGTLYCNIESTYRLLCILPDGTKVLGGEVIPMHNSFTLKKYENGGMFYFENDALKRVYVDPITKAFVYNTVLDFDTSMSPIDSYRTLRKENMSVSINRDKVLVIKSPSDVIEYTCDVNSQTDYDVHCTENYLYWEKNGCIFRLNLTTGSKETLFDGASNYVFYDYPNVVYSKIYVQSDDVVHFRARKLTEGFFIAGKIDKGVFSEEVVDESNNNAVISFVKIN